MSSLLGLRMSSFSYSRRALHEGKRVAMAMGVTTIHGSHEMRGTQRHKYCKKCGICACCKRDITRRCVGE